ncbi:lytic murein transglycosylase B [Herbaspirillum lusitanum]|uniref:lytic murein transglycosylase B n=1 Tax=Herbaspirillum lusitanum TaxID=213312 RepID=UPI00059051C3|nr:lytic murein transglycosylase B [Herbaspirillum lusitanum]
MKPCLRLLRLLGLSALSLACLIPAAVHAESTTRKNQTDKSKSSNTKAKNARQAKPKKKAAPADDGEFANFSQWKEVNDFIDDMVARNGFDKAALQALFNKARYIDTAIQLIKPAPSGKPKNWQAYRARFVEPKRINAGVDFWNEHELALSRAEAQYGVPAEIIVGIIGVETVYGRNTGNFRVLDAITTLAFDYPKTANRDARMAFFRGELENTLLFARESNIDPFSLLGSYAGAIGWPQFMPSSIRQYAVDFDGNGKIDLRSSPVDAIGSVANFLKIHGWQRGEPTVFPATVTDAGKIDNLINQGLEAKFSPDELRAAGVVSGSELPAGLRFGLVDLQNGTNPTEYWIGTANFFAITQYNRSYFYAMSVAELGRAVAAARNR